MVFHEVGCDKESLGKPQTLLNTKPTVKKLLFGVRNIKTSKKDDIISFISSLTHLLVLHSPLVTLLTKVTKVTNSY